jgi:hypothetical protein
MSLLFVIDSLLRFSSLAHVLTACARIRFDYFMGVKMTRVGCEKRPHNPEVG